MAGGRPEDDADKRALQGFLRATQRFLHASRLRFSTRGASGLQFNDRQGTELPAHGRDRQRLGRIALEE